MNAAPSPLWSEPLQRFNLLPSHSLHASRAQQWLPGYAGAAPWLVQPACQRHWHRQWSQLLLERLRGDAQPVLDLSHPVLPLALASPTLLESTGRHAGFLLLGKNLRHRIARAAVQEAEQAIGSTALRWVCTRGADLHPGLDEPLPWLAPGLAAGADALGAGLLAHCWHDAPAPLRRRADWKLPLDAESAASREVSGMTPAQARSLCLQILLLLEPQWLSSFPATH